MHLRRTRTGRITGAFFRFSKISSAFLLFARISLLFEKRLLLPKGGFENHYSGMICHCDKIATDKIASIHLIM